MVMRSREEARRRRLVGQTGLDKALARPETAIQKARRPRVGVLREIGGALLTVARGEAKIPLPGVGMLGPGRALQLRSIGRQQLGRIPLPAKIVGGAVGATALAEVLTGEAPIPLARQLILRAGQGVGKRMRGAQPSKRRPSMARKGALAVGQELPPAHVVVRTWQTFPGGPVFARLADGHIAVQKKDGTIKHFRPYRPVCIPRKFDAKALRRVATALKRQRKAATAIMKLTGGFPKGR